MSGRSLVVAAQAVVVGVLIFVVYFTLLKPEGQDSLLGIDAPGSATGSFPAPGSYTEGDEAGGDAPGGQAPAGGGANAQGGGMPGRGTSVTGTATALVPTSPSATPDAATEASASDAESPAGDQYGDTLARLTARLN